MNQPLLEVAQVSLSVANKEILHDLSFALPLSGVAALLGANGSGKTTLLKAIFGYPDVSIKGKIAYSGKELTSLSANERAALGIKFTFQHPPTLRGITLSNMINIALKRKPDTLLLFDEIDLVKKFKLFEFLNRDIHHGFSGGERKRADILLTLFQKPQLLLLDEPDSGVDIQSLKIIGTELNTYLVESGASAIIVTHQGAILEYVKPDSAIVLNETTGKQFTNTNDMLNKIKETSSYDLTN